MIKKFALGTLTITALFTYVVFITLAIFLYAGGTEADPGLTAYVFFGNSLSDLGVLYTYDGAVNFYSAIVFTIGTTFFGLSFIPFSMGFFTLFKEKKVSKILALIASILGYVVVAGMVLIAFTPHNYGPLINLLHMIGVFAAYICMFLSTLLYGIAIFLEKPIKNVYGIIAVVFCAFFLTTLIMGLLGLGGDASNLIQQIGQKVGRSLTVITYIALSIPLLKSND